uniref:Uncharacterized protein n=1 Tax=Kalanchoe fedtschenkoi TaxID=63787 RepID=A0A7N1A070_KALFE
MAASSSLLLQSLSAPSSSHTRLFAANRLRTWLPTATSLRPRHTLRCSPRSSVISFAVAESDPSKFVEPDFQALLQELADCFSLPSDYFAQLPQDLRLDLNDAAFDLSNGRVIDECGQELGNILLNLSKAWESADASTSSTLISRLPLLVGSLTDGAKTALGKRLVAAGRRYQSMGLYGQGELQKIANTMTKVGKLLASLQVSQTTKEPRSETRMFKFGELQVAITADKANIGAAIAFVFGIISWELTQGIQNVPESSLQYANDNALILAKSLRGALLAAGYSSTFLSAFASAGLILLGIQLKSEANQKDK